MSVAILLPHMDDEVFILPYLCNISKVTNLEVEIYFLTKSEGRNFKFKQEIREEESRLMFSKLLPSAQIHFVGRNLEVKDLELHKKLKQVYNYLVDQISSDCTLIVSPQYEGGHIDHDSAHYIAYKIAHQKNIQHLNFPLYRARFNRGIFYSVAQSELLNSHQTYTFLNTEESVRLLLKTPIIYKSQFRTWLGLFPFLLWKTFKQRHIVLIETIPIDYSYRPNGGNVLYENRNDEKFDNWKSYLF